MSDVSLAFNLLVGRNDVPGELGKTTNAVRSANLMAAASAVALRGAEASAAAYAISLGSAISGSIGLAPAVFLGAASTAIGLRFALGGLSSAWHALGAQQAAAGPSAAQVARQQASAVREVTSAQEALAGAQRDALAAQKAISDAEETAAKNIRDLSLAAAGARLDEQSATLAVADAQKALIAARQSGNAEDIQKANIALQQSGIDLDSAKNKTSDLAEENGKATKQGVEGSDEVTAARQKQVDATQAIADATQRLADAQANLNSGSGGGGQNAAAAAMAKLSTNGKALINTLHGLAPAWASVQRNVQNKLFAGVAGDVKDLSAKYLPVLNGRLGDMGKAFNSGIRESLGLLKSKQAVSDVNTLLTNTNKATGLLASSFAPIIGGLLGMGATGSNFLPKLAGWVHGLAVEFGNWVTEARKSGQLATWLNTAENALHALWIIAGNVAGMIGAIFHGPGVAGGGAQLLGTIVKLTTKFRDFLNSPKGQRDIGTVLGDLRNILGSLGKLLPGVAGNAGLFSSSLGLLTPVMKFLGDHTATVVKLLPWLAGGFLAVKLAEAGANVASIIRLPLLAAQVISTWGMKSALQANTLALKANSLATDEQAVAADGAAVAQDGLNLAFFLSPVGLVVIAIIALIAIFVLLWVKCKWFRDFWKGLWKDIQEAASFVWSWIKDHWQLLLAILTGPVGLAVLFIKDHFHQILDFITGLPGKISHAAKGMWDGIPGAFKLALNMIIKSWDSLHFKVPSMNLGPLGKIGGFDLGLGYIHPLAQGGVVKHSAGGTLALIGEGGEDEVVAPLSSLSHMDGGGGSVTLTINSGGSELDALILKLIRKAVRAEGGNGRALAIKTVG